MTATQKHVLSIRETDIQGAIRRMGDNEDLYLSCLRMFLDDPTMIQLNNAIESHSWDDAFTAAHALKGLAGNMGFIPLMHSIGQLVILIRGGRTKEVRDCVSKVNSNYRDITDTIRKNFVESAKGE